MTAGRILCSEAPKPPLDGVSSSCPEFQEPQPHYRRAAPTREYELKTPRVRRRDKINSAKRQRTTHDISQCDNVILSGECSHQQDDDALRMHTESSNERLKSPNTLMSTTINLQPQGSDLKVLSYDLSPSGIAIHVPSWQSDGITRSGESITRQGRESSISLQVPACQFHHSAISDPGLSTANAGLVLSEHVSHDKRVERASSKANSEMQAIGPSTRKRAQTLQTGTDGNELSFFGSWVFDPDLFEFRDCEHEFSLHTENPEASSFPLQAKVGEETIDETSIKKFACPFLKHDISKKDPPAICKHGWDNVRRLKEHIFRRHSISGHVCDRCHDEFREPSDLKLHRESSPPCEVRPQQLDKITPAQKAQLKSRKAPFSRSEAEKWIEVYKICFPEANDTPSPYNDESPAELITETASFLRRLDITIDDHQQYIRHELQEDFPDIDPGILAKVGEATLQKLQRRARYTASKDTQRLSINNKESSQRFPQDEAFHHSQNMAGSHYTARSDCTALTFAVPPILPVPDFYSHQFPGFDPPAYMSSHLLRSNAVLPIWSHTGAWIPHDTRTDAGFGELQIGRPCPGVTQGENYPQIDGEANMQELSWL